MCELLKRKEGEKNGCRPTVFMLSNRIYRILGIYPFFLPFRLGVKMLMPRTERGHNNADHI